MATTARDGRETLGWPRWLAAHGVAVGVFWLAGVVLFLVFAGRIDNAFAETARREHVGSIVRVHLVVLPAYLIVALVGTWLSHPLERRLDGRRRRRGRGRRPFAMVAARAFAWQVGLFVLSFGWVSLAGSISLDVLARMVAPAFPGFDPYVFYTWHVREVFVALMIGLVGLALVDLARSGVALLRRLPAPLRAGAVAVTGCGLIAVLAAWAAAGPAAPKSPPRPHVIVVAADSLRWDRLSSHGYARPTTPNIDRIVAEAVDFDAMHVATASTLESWTSFLTGRWPANHGVRYMFIGKEEADRVAADPDTLPRTLDRLGYDTVAVGDWAANCFSLVDLGFEETATSDVQNLDVFLFEVAYLTHALVPHYFGNAFGERLMPMMNQVTAYVNPDALSQRFLDRLDASAEAGRPFFGVFFLSCTHLPYASPYPFNRRFVDPAYRGPNAFQLDFDVDDFIQHGFPDEVPDDQKQRVIDLYDGGVAWFDDTVGRIDRHLRERGLDRDTILVITSDHGDDLYEPGTTLGHGTNFFGGDQSTRIPFVMRLPGREHAGRRVGAITRNVDVMPTLLDLVLRDEGGLPAAPCDVARIDGVSLAPAAAGETDDLGLAAFAETCYLFFPKRLPGEEVYAMQPADRTLEIDPDFRNLFVLKDDYRDYVIETKDRMMRTDRWKLIHVKGVHGPIWRFHDMAADPAQLHDLSAEPPADAPFEAMKAALLHWMATGEDAPAPR